MERGQFALDEIRREIGVANASRIVVAQLDLESTMNIRKFAREFLSLEKRLDILINNAGVMNVPQGWTLDGFEVTFGINHLGWLSNLPCVHMQCSPLSLIPSARSLPVDRSPHKCTRRVCAESRRDGVVDGVAVRIDALG